MRPALKIALGIALAPFVFAAIVLLIMFTVGLIDGLTA